MTLRRDLSRWAAPLLVAATAAAYGPVLRAGFIWDDDGHVTRPELRSWHGLVRIWIEPGATQQYYPVVHTAFWVEHRLWGDGAAGYHLANLALHLLASLLLARVLALILRAPNIPPGAWIAAGLFALHPVGVESVAWVSEQKNTLSTVFALGALLAYLSWRDRSAPEPARYAAATGLFVLALLTKSVTATLPAAILVIVWWREGRPGNRRDWRALAPWLAAALAMAVCTAWVERTYIGARGAHFALSAGQRILLAGRIAWFYLGKLLWPAHLSFQYPRWAIASWGAKAAVWPVLVFGALLGGWAIRRRTRGPLAVALLYLGLLTPALGFIDVYPFVFSYVADHFQYLASLAVFGAAGLLWENAFAAGANRSLLALSAAAVLVLCGVLTWKQARTYRNVETLYARTLEQNPASWLAHENLGVVLAGEGRWEQAREHYRAALQLNPDYAETHGNYANALSHSREWPAAVAEYAAALRLRPDFAPARANGAKAQYAWASELANAGRLGEAIDHYRAALALDPGLTVAAAELGLAELYSGRASEAVATLQEAVHRSPKDAPAHAYLGLALARCGSPAEAVGEFRTALRLEPANADTHYQLGLVLQALGRWQEAAAEFRAAGPAR